MTESNSIEERVLQLPSDQDASGRTLGSEEIQALTEVIKTGTLTSTKGRFVRTFETEFAKTVGAKHAYACASGTAAVHLAIAAINPNPGDEIVTTPITDMGALTPILYQGAIPVFADVDDRTCNVTAATIEARLSDRTKAIVVTHLFGNPCEMDEIMELAAARNLPVIEDCAQSFLAAYGGRKVGTIGRIGCFSLQQGKHITTGEGGIVDDRRRRPGPAHVPVHQQGLGLRRREAGSLLPRAQLPHERAAGRRRPGAAAQARWGGRAAPAHGRSPHRAAEGHSWHRGAVGGARSRTTCTGSTPSWWTSGSLRAVRRRSAKALKSYDIASAPRYIQKPAFMCDVIRNQRTLGDSRWPFSLARPEAVDYDRAKHAGTYRALDRILVLPWNEGYTEEHVDYLAQSFRTAVASLSGGKRS